MRMVTLCASLGLALSPGAVLAHGSLETPVSRVYNCYLENPESPDSDACKAVVAAGGTQPLYDWMEVNQPAANGRHKKVVPDGTLCGGGREKYVGLDLPRSDWVATRIKPDADGKFSFVFLAWAPHSTKYFRFYVTKDGWKKNQPIAWSDLEQFANVSGEPELQDGRYVMRVKLPEGKTGRHVIYLVWQRDDSMEAFYTCSDVIFRSATATSSAESYESAGAVVAHNALPAGTVVAFRIFDPKGRDVARYEITLTRATSAAEAWPKALADTVNAAAEGFRIGVEDDDGSIAPAASASLNRVYRDAARAGYRYAIDIDTP